MQKLVRHYLKSTHYFTILIITFCLFISLQVNAQQSNGPRFEHFDFKQTTPPISEEKREEIEIMLEENKIKLEQKGIQIIQEAAAAVSLQWPLKLATGLKDPGYHGTSGFVDHNPNYPNLVLDYNCGIRSYDLNSGYNHSGTDFFTWPFSWHKMENDEVWVVAAAPGTIIGRSDGNFDRNCEFGGDNWNAVYVQHSDGSVAWYGHLKKDSVTSKQVGDQVVAGENLGIVGSSGNSTGPHLHFELHDDQNNIIDPYAGPCNQITSLWADQRPYYDSAINALKTHSAQVDFHSCPQPATKNEQNRFEAGDTIYFYTYYRDQLAGQESQYTTFRPDGTVYDQWTGSSSQPHWAASYSWWTINFPQDVMHGIWKFQVIYEGITYTHNFFIGNLQNIAPALMLLLNN
jgi:murein DD-endopeptidase MepM/ murein hydrolase activator NlpD